MRVVLPFKLVGQKLVKGRDFPKSVADGSRDSVVIKVGGIPDGCIAKGYFKLSWENNATYDLTFDGDELVVDEYIVTLPTHANNKYIDYTFSFSLAIWEGDIERLTTSPVEIVVEKSNYSDTTTNTPDIPESQYEALAQSVADVVDLTNSINEDVSDHGRRITALEKGGGGDVSAVRFTEQELTPEQQAQARKNIGAGLPHLRFTVTKSAEGKYESSNTFQELYEAYTEGRTLTCQYYRLELPLMAVVDDVSLTFCVVKDDRSEIRIDIINLGEEFNNVVKVIEGKAPSISIGDQMWGGDDEEWSVDFTDTINEMIDDKVGNLRIVNARDYGAVGDGVTDDTESIQNALHYAEEQGLPLYIPAGNYLVSKTISTYTEADSDKQSNTLNIFGSGMSTMFTTTEDFEGDYVFYIDYKREQPGMLWVHDFAIDLYADVSGIYIRKMGMKSVVENLWISFRREKQEGEPVREGIFCESSVVATIQRIKVGGNAKGYRQGNCGIVCRKMYSTKIIDCDVLLLGWGIYLSGGSGNLIEHCRIDENEYGICQNSSTNIEADVRAYPYDNSIPVDEQFCGVFQNLTIRKNRFEANNQVSIYLVSYADGALGYLHNKNTTIADNYFSGLGAGTAMWTDKEVFRKAIRLGRCDGVFVVGNLFKGSAHDTANDFVSRQQNISMVTSVSDISLRDNVAISWPDGKDEDGNTIASKSSTKLPIAITKLGLLDDIELNQTTRGEASVRRSLRVDVTTSGTVDVSGGNVLRLSDGVTISGLTISNSTDANTSQEVTLIATGTATVKHANAMHLEGGADFVMGKFDTLTLISVYSAGVRWVEKSRSVNRAT